MSTKDKQKVIGETLDAGQVARFLELQPYDESSTDFHVLEKAYRGLPAEAFDEFLHMFKEQGRDINAANSKGQTLLAIASEHASQLGYVSALKKNGAQ